DGVIYAVEVGTELGQSDIWRWDSVTDTTPDKVYETAERYWYAYNSTVDGNVTIGFSSPATSGPVTFFSDTFPSSTSSFAFEESAPLASKMGLTFNEDATEVWTVADTGPYEPLY